MAVTPAPAAPRSRETLWAILGSAVIAIILATVIAGNPFRSLQLAYLDYSNTPAGGAAKGTPTPTTTTQSDTAALPPK